MKKNRDSTGDEMHFDEMFRVATGKNPYPYQRSLATMHPMPAAVNASTGAGKTAAVVMAWIHRRRFAAAEIREQTPRRLVLCFPMRTLVTQSVRAIREWLTNLGLIENGTGLQRGQGVGIYALMGGAVADDWHLHPEKDAILVGTQDMLLSRALNRGYASSRFQWPWDFALLSNDCLWVFDEVQLMGVGLATGLQLAGFRTRFGTFGLTHSVFMSATLERSWLNTVDHPEPREEQVLRLSNEDLETPTLSARRTAQKRLSLCQTRLKPGDKASCAKLADEILRQHVEGTRTLVVVNRVDTALLVFDRLEKAASKRKLRLVLLHSRYRMRDRDRVVNEATAGSFEGIVVATQVVEAGVDMTSRTLFTEIAPWASIVQRAGRCNRGGEYTEADIFWIDHEDADPEKLAAPYVPEDLQHARANLLEMTSFNPRAIEERGVKVPLKPHTNVIRTRDMIDLFDTTPDLAGADLDISRFIREGDDRDVQVFWRDWSRPDRLDHADLTTKPRRDELCSVPVHKFREWRKSRNQDAFVWNALDGMWERLAPQRVVAGQVILLHVSAGAYLADRGWDETSTTVVDEVPRDESETVQQLESVTDDRDSYLDTFGTASRKALGKWVELSRHSLDARDAAMEIVEQLRNVMSETDRDIVVRSAHAHDLGKRHSVFQITMNQDRPQQQSTSETSATPVVWAKSGAHAKHSRPGFRHELASALAWLQVGAPQERDLIAYLLAAHHGKVRLSIRALPIEQAPSEPGRLFARGVWDGEEMEEADLGAGLCLPKVKLSLAPMQLGLDPLGQASWTDRVISLRDSFGPFRLAFLEALVRAADVRASIKEAVGGGADNG